MQQKKVQTNKSAKNFKDECYSHTSELHASSFLEDVFYEVVLFFSVNNFWDHLIDNICSTQKIQKSVQLE